MPTVETAMKYVEQAFSRAKAYGLLGFLFKFLYNYNNAHSTFRI